MAIENTAGTETGIKPVLMGGLSHSISVLEIFKIFSNTEKNKRVNKNFYLLLDHLFVTGNMNPLI